MNRRGRLILGGVSVLAGAVAFALSFTLPDVGEPAYPHSYNEYANGYAISRLPMAAIALILVGAVIGVLPAGRSPYRLILSAIAVATAPLGVVDAVRPFVSNGDVPSPPLNRIAFVAALAVGLLLIAGAAAIAGQGPVVTVASPVAVLVATAALSASLQHSSSNGSWPWRRLPWWPSGSAGPGRGTPWSCVRRCPRRAEPRQRCCDRVAADQP